MKTFLSIFRDEKGQDLIEYALIMALLVIAAVGGVAIAHAGHLRPGVPAHGRLHHGSTVAAS